MESPTYPESPESSFNQEEELENPFLFLQPYTLEENYNLKGRENEAAALLALLKWKDIIIVFGKSGVGKTSFINQTLSDKINRVSWLPIRITRLLNINQSINRALTVALQSQTTAAIHKSEVNKIAEQANEESTSQNSVDLIKELFLKWNRPIYLIIDQLEELFLIGDKDEQDQFLETLQDLMSLQESQKKVILVLREEHLGFIQEIESILNGVFQDALAIKEIRRDDGEKVYLSLLEAPVLKDSEQARAFKAKVLQNEIKPLLLNSCIIGETFAAQKIQILMFLIWEALNGNAPPKTDQDLLQVVKNLCYSKNPLKDYLEDTVNTKLAADAKLLKARYWFVLRKSISNANTKKPISLFELYEAVKKAAMATYNQNIRNTIDRRDSLQEQDFFRIDAAMVYLWCDQLADKHLLQKIADTSDKNPYFQLQHDILVNAIKQLDPQLPLRFPRKMRVEDVVINPYQGLHQYDRRDEQKVGGLRSHTRPKPKPKMYGRDTLVREYIEFLKTEKCLVVVGDSGTGKSSLVKGGLLPALELAGYETRTLQPGPDIKKFEKNIRELIAETETSHGAEKAKFCVYIDQFEECYTFRSAASDETDNFENFLSYLKDEIESTKNNLKLIVSIRHDYAHEFDRRIDQWRRFKKLLRYPTTDEIFDIIVGPAYDQGVDFKPSKLPERIAADASNTSYFLPLLSFTLQTLYQEEVIAPAVRNGTADPLFLTDTGYEKTGEIVNCLQNEFTKTYKTLDPGEQLIFSQLMTRMIVIKDTIPKAQPLAISRISYSQPGKTDEAREVLKRFCPLFIRIRTIDLNGVKEDCYEPIHDSLLIYCNEVRQIVNTVSQPNSQMYLQPRLESIFKEWKTHKERANHSISTSDGLEGFIQKYYKDLEPLYDLLRNQDTSPHNHWLFAEEFELVTDGLKFAELLNHQENIVSHSQNQERQLKRKEQELLDTKLRADLDRALSEKNAQVVDLEIKTSKAHLKSQRQKTWIITLALALTLAISVSNFLYQDHNRQGALLEQQTMARHTLEQYNKSLRNQKSVIEKTVASLRRSKAETVELNAVLTTNKRDLEHAVEELRKTKKKLTLLVAQQDTSILLINRTNQKLLDALARYAGAQVKIDSLRNVRSITLAQLNKVVSPSLSYRLAEHALKTNKHDSLAAKLHHIFNNTSQYFESLIRNNVIYTRVSVCGDRILTIESDSLDIDTNHIWIWDTNGKLQSKPLAITGKPNTAEFSFDGKTALLATENEINLLNVEESKIFKSLVIQDLLYTKFSETDNMLYAITNSKVIIYSIANNVLNQIQTIRFESEGIINNARLNKNMLSVITPKGIGSANIITSSKVTFIKLPQSFILNDGGHILAVEKPFLSNYRNLVLFDSTLTRQWRTKLTDKGFNLVTGYTNSKDGNFSIIKFNERGDFIQNTQQQQRQTQRLFSSIYNAPETSNIYYLDFTNIEKRKMTPIFNRNLVNGAFLLTNKSDSVLEFSGGSIVKSPIIRSRFDFTSYWDTISENTRFRQVFLAGKNNDLIVSLDENNQLKLWRYGTAQQLDNRNQLWNGSLDEINKLLSFK